MKVIVLLTFFLLNLYAHPHFFVDAYIDIQKDKISHKWVFDRLNSRLLTFDFDKDKNKHFEKTEQISFIEKHIEKLKSDNYNLFMDLDSNELVADPINIKVEIVNKRVEVSFDLLFKINEGGTICTIDPTLYFAYKLKDIKSAFEYEKQVSEHDYCIGVTK